MLLLIQALVLCARAQSSGGLTWGEPIWSDEFNTRIAGAPPDPAKWNFDIGADQWGNKELETYCGPGSSQPKVCDPKHPNAYLDGSGHLIIEARKVKLDPQPGETWTSARLKTDGTRDIQYGRVETCMKLPVGPGLWSAFWMLGSHAPWPAGGEMDIMENVPATGGAGGGLGPTVIESTIHGPSSSPKGLYSLAADYTFPNGKRIDDTDPACHIYGAVWSPFMVQIYVDDWRKPFFIRTASDVPAGDHWIFNRPFYFILNLAIGGEWPGPPSGATPNPSQMTVDYVRAYKAGRVPGPTMSANPIKMTGVAGAATLRLTSGRDSGFVYLACATESSTASCSVDSGNALNTSVVEFKDAPEQTARILVTASTNPEDSLQHYSVIITAHTVSGDESSLKIPVLN